MRSRFRTQIASSRAGGSPSRPCGCGTRVLSPGWHLQALPLHLLPLRCTGIRVRRWIQSSEAANQKSLAWPVAGGHGAASSSTLHNPELLRIRRKRKYTLSPRISDLFWKRNKRAWGWKRRGGGTIERRVGGGGCARGLTRQMKWERRRMCEGIDEAVRRDWPANLLLYPFYRKINLSKNFSDLMVRKNQSWSYMKLQFVTRQSP